MTRILTALILLAALNACGGGDCADNFVGPVQPGQEAPTCKA